MRTSPDQASSSFASTTEIVTFLPEGTDTFHVMDSPWCSPRSKLEKPESPGFRKECKKKKSGWVILGKGSHRVSAWVAGIDDDEAVRAFGGSPSDMGRSTLHRIVSHVMS